LLISTLPRHTSDINHRYKSQLQHKKRKKGKQKLVFHQKDKKHFPTSKMWRSNPEGAERDPMETDGLSQSQPPMVTSQDTRIARSTDTRVSPCLPPWLFHRAAIRWSQSQQSQKLAEPLLSPEMSRQHDRINRSLHLYEDNLAQSMDQEYLGFQTLPPQIQHLVLELSKVK